MNHYSKNHNVSAAKLSRRQLLKSLGVGTVGLGFGTAFGGSTGGAVGINSTPARTLRAQSEPATDSLSGIYRFKIGDFLATAIQDGVVPFDPAIFGTNVPEDEVYALLEAHNLPVSTVNLSINVLLLQNGDSTILIDTGLGGAAVGISSGPPNSGKLLPTLAAIGVTPDAVNHVILSHFLFDHTSGLPRITCLCSPMRPTTSHRWKWTSSTTRPPMRRLII